MLKSYRNQVLRTIQENGHDPSLFKIHEGDDGAMTVFQVSVPESPIFFRFRQSSQDFHEFDCMYCPFKPGFPVLGPIPRAGFETFQSMLERFGEWLRFSFTPYLDEQETPDLWSALTKEAELSRVGSEAEDNTPFSPLELKRVAASLSEIKEYLLQTHQQLAQEQIDYIEDRFRYLEEASARMGRKDWINITIGVFSNIIVGVALAPDTAREIFRIAGQVFKWVITTVPLLP